VTLTFDLLTLKVVFESRVTWATSVPILVFLGLSVLDLAPMYATDRRQTASLLNIIITKHTLHICNNEQMQSLIHKNTVQ